MRGILPRVLLTSILPVLIVAVPLAAQKPTGNEDEITADSCVKPVGDLNGDGMTDYAASRRASAGAPVVHLLFGSGEPLPATLDVQYIRQHAALVLRGPRAAPFTCAENPIRVIPRARGLARTAVRKRRPLADSPIGRPPSYTMIDLDPLMPGYSTGFSSTATGMNARGQVVGQFFTQESDRAFVYDNGEVRDLGTLGGHTSDARDINDAGTIVGYSLTGEVDNFGFVNHAFLSDGFSLTGLGIPSSSAEGINNADQIVGEMRVQPEADLNHAFLYQQGFATDLGSLPPLNESAHSAALSVNDTGQIVGESDTFVAGLLNPLIRFFAVHAFLYENGTMRDVGSLGPVCLPLPVGGERCIDSSTATDINNFGQIVGFSTTLGGTHAFMSANDTLRDLGTLGGSGSWAYGVNDSGQVVGGSLNTQEQFVPFLFDHGTLNDLNTLIVSPSGALPFAAYAINNFGQIAGNHHLLNPVYDAIAPGQELAFNAPLGETLTFQYWLARREFTACHAIRNQLRLQIKIDLKGRPDVWVPVAQIPGCDESRDWGVAAFSVPASVHETSARVRIRVRESGRSTDPVVYLRHFELSAGQSEDP